MDLSNIPLHFPHQETSSHSNSQSPDNMTQNSNQNQNDPTQDNKKPRPPDSDPQKCPRCESTNTKFCYYNNYSLTQPRYFCKSCRRYWTKGGTLRNVPVGGGCRKSSKRSSSSPSQFLKKPQGRDNLVPTMAHHFPNNLNAYPNTGLLGMGFDQDLTQPMSQRDVFGQYDGMEFMQYGNGGSTGLMFQSMCGYEEANCASGISEEMGVAPYEEVKQGMMGLPWQGMNGEIASLENNWSGFVGNPAWGLLNTPALM